MQHESYSVVPQAAQATLLALILGTLIQNAYIPEPVNLFSGLDWEKFRTSAETTSSGLAALNLEPGI
jgi:hypothetical protein